MKSTFNYKKEIIEFHAWVATVVPRLRQLKVEDNRIAFDELMEKVLPEVKQYINRQLRIALQNKTLPEGKYKLADFTDELYLETFENIENLPTEQHLHQWLFSKADEIMEDTIIEEEFDNAFFKNIDNHTKEEWLAMEEKFSRDGDGDLVMLEELDDISYSKLDYSLEDVFIENEELDVFKRINEKLTEEEIKKQIEFALFILPFHIRTIFELSINQQFDAEEISQIKGISVAEVETILAKAKKIIRENFLKRTIRI